jgi:hypothetical protein
VEWVCCCMGGQKIPQVQVFQLPIRKMVA